ncbi:MAG: diaminopimelate decarboxylase [Defluviitaleaceae bacterium]|nr:diaminopimelate decarboxylase [Defluviitaleaceae bacterium]
MSFNHVTESFDFYQGHNPRELAANYGSPLYVYNERIFRKRCNEMVTLCKYPKFYVNYAVKANTNLTLQKIAREEGCRADISSAGEAVAALAAGFKPEEMLFVVNSCSSEELEYAVNLGMTVSVDSLSQLEKLGKVNRGGRIALRFNPGIGGGHHEKVVTGGDGTKFGIMPEYIPEVREILQKYELKLIGINHHIGSQNWGDLYIKGVEALLELAHQFDDLEFIDLGGGLAVPYNKQNYEKPINLQLIGERVDNLIAEFNKNYGKEVDIFIEPGRYLAAECGVLLGTVHSLKNCGKSRYAGTDMGFSVFARPTLYDAYHDIEIYRNNADGENSGTGKIDTSNQQIINIVGNQCESGDYIAKERKLPQLVEGDVLGVLDAGAYGYSMSCQYNHRPRPAEILIQQDNTLKLIRRRDTHEDIIANMMLH